MKKKVLAMLDIYELVTCTLFSVGVMAVAIGLLRGVEIMQVWCIEHDKYAGRGTAYYKVLINPTDHQLGILRFRAMINPELGYWATRLDETCPDVEIETMLKQKKFRKEPYFTEV